MQKKLIISYSGDDNEAAHHLHQILSGANYEVWIADEDLTGAVKWTQTLVEAIDDCDGLILLWSEAAKKSKHVNEEIKIARVFHKPIFPILAIPGSSSRILPEEINELQVITKNSFQQSANELIERLQDPTRNKIEWNDKIKNGYIPKSPNPRFVGRKKELKELFVDTIGFHGQSKKLIPIVISGMAGIGKTHLALTFAYRFNTLFPDGVYWINTPNGIVSELHKIGTHLGIEKLEDERPNEYASRVTNKLNELENGLLIFDNVIDINEFRKWCPEGSKSCAIILTTRKSFQGYNVHVINLRELDAESAFELIISRREDGPVLSKDKRQSDALQEICKIMGNHPLGLEFCAKYLQSHIVKPVQFLNEIRKDVFTIEPHFKPFIGEGDATLLEILKLSYEKMKKELVEPYFLLMVWFPPHGINIDLLVNAYDNAEEGRKALDELADNNFIYFERELNLVYLHPLVVQFGRAIQKSEIGAYQTLFSETILKFLNQNKNDLTTDQVQKELPHILEAIEVTDKHELWDLCAQLRLFYANITGDIDISIEQLNIASNIIEQHLEARTADLPGICIQLGKKYRSKAQFQRALVEFEKAQKYYNKSQTTESLNQSGLDFEFGDTYLALGRYKEAEKILLKALDTALNTASLDEMSPEVCRIQQSLAKIDLFLGRVQEAERKLKAVLENRKEFHRIEPSAEMTTGIASCYNDLSQVALELGLYKQAIEYAGEAFKTYKLDKNEDDSAFGYLYLQLSAIYYEAADYEKAINNVKKAQENLEKIYGKKHPSYASTLILSSNIQRKLGKFQDASEKINEAINILKEQYPDENHPFMAQALEVQGKIYDHLCDFENEEKTWKKLLSIQNSLYSEVNPAAATTHYDYGHLFLKKGDFENAIKHLELSIEIVKQIYDTTEHILYFRSLARLALCYYSKQDYAIAQEKLNEAGKLYPKIIGDNPHPLIARMLQLRSEVNRRLGDFTAALKDIDEAIELKEKIYNPEHPSVAEALEVKVKIYHHTGEVNQAKELIERALNIRIKHYGEEHLEVGKSEHDLGSFYLRLGDYKNAITHFEKALNIITSKFGKFHPDFIESSLHLANVYDEQGEYPKASKIIDDLESVIKKTITETNHYLKARWLQQKAEIQRRLGKFKDALAIIEKAIEMKEKIYNDPLHPSIADALEIQGKILDHLGEFEEEEKVWNKILKIQKKAYSEEHPDIAKTRFNYANLLMKQGKIEQAVGELQQSVDMTKKIFGEEHIHYFGRLVLLAACYYEQQQYTSANERLKEAKELRGKIFDKNLHPYVARMLQLRSEVNRRLGNFTAALDDIDEAIEMKEKIYNSEHPSVAESLEVKVKIYHHTGEVKPAKDLIERALDIRITAYGKDHPEVGKSEHDFGSFYLRLGDYKNAIVHFEKALNITKATFSEFHPDYIERSLHLANAYDEQGEYQKVTEIVDNLEKVIETTITEENHYLKARWLQQKAELSRRLGEFDEALEIVEKAITMKEKIYDNPLHPSVADALEIQGKIFDHLGKFEDEEKVWKRIFEIQEKAYPENHPEIAETNYNYGNLFLKRGEFDNAVKFLNASVNITAKNVGTNNSQYFGRLIRLATSYFLSQDFDRTQAKLREADALCSKIFGEASHPYIARMLQLKAELALQLGELDNASAFIEASIKMKESIYRTDHPSVAEALEIKVDLKLAQYDTEASLEFLKRIEAIRQKNYGKDHPEYSNYLMRLAQYYLASNEYTLAEEKINDSIKIWSDKFSGSHIEMIKRKVMAAQIARIAGRAEQAEKYINEANTIVKETLKIEQSLLVSSILTEESVIKRKLGDYTGSLERVDRAIQIEEKILGTKSPSLIKLDIDKIKLLLFEYRLSEARTLIEKTLSKVPATGEPIFQRLKGRLLNQRGILEIYSFDFVKALKTLDEAIELNKSDKISKVDLAKLYIDKSVALRALARYDEALNYLDEAQNINNPHFDTDHVYFARICLENGLTFYCKKSYFAAKVQLDDALKIYEIKMNQDPREHAQTLEALGLINLETNFLTEAAQFFSEAIEIKKKIYKEGHPEFAMTHFNEAQVLLKRYKQEEDKAKIRSLALEKLIAAQKIISAHVTKNTALLQKIQTCLAELDYEVEN